MADGESVGFPELDSSAVLTSDDSGFQSTPVQDEQQEDNRTVTGRMNLYAKLLQISQYSYLHVFMSEELSLRDLEEARCRTVQEIGDKVTLLRLENIFYPYVGRMRLRLAFDVRAQRFSLPSPLLEDIMDLTEEDSPVKLLGSIKGNTNGHPFIDILTPYYERAVMVWIFRYNWLLNITSGHIRLVGTGRITFNKLLRKEEIDIMNTINVRVEFLSGERRELTTGEDVITEPCVISVDPPTD
ncbi:uncharacterized protein LOC124111106 [Haliotis rufescens]|uniref:uncharacterized protein LOC124111106 n=1 Tax=Haliotis rufescens TaxID=6454 RepID=UPI00201EBD3C|nr:uncharacterized protein LOC124111106 [Haliotis rufescens]